MLTTPPRCQLRLQEDSTPTTSAFCTRILFVLAVSPEGARHVEDPALVRGAVPERPTHTRPPSTHRAAIKFRHCFKPEYRDKHLYFRKSTTPVSRLYIEPAILMLPLDSSSRSTGLCSRILAIVSSTFFRATASTKA